jgi:hypothetical protein
MKDVTDLLADSYNFLNRYKNYYSHLLTVHRVSDVRQIKVHTVKPLLPHPSFFRLKLLLQSRKGINLQVVIKFCAHLIQAGGEMLQSESHEVINSVWNKEELLISGRSLLLYQFTRRMIKLAIVIILG